MSSSPHDPQDDAEDKQPVDELDEQHGGDTEGEATTKDVPAKRGRGRPKGSKNKRPGSIPAAAAGSSTAAVTPRKRGRPPKEKKPDDEGEPPAKRKRGRPPKNPKPDAGDSAGGDGDAPDPSAKKKRGRPSKKATD
ncbi:hypothetical protein H0H87_000094 [Tephrocybe sp. NHM501043]|nr:hypothetical protein H0H87_000094 [Tephrocybe sp. NHM501043]